MDKERFKELYWHDPTFRAVADMVKATGYPADRKSTALALRMARQLGIYNEILEYALAERRHWRKWLTLTQAKWMQSARHTGALSHHDSWSIREQYVRIHNGPSDYVSGLPEHILETIRVRWPRYAGQYSG